MMPSALVPGGVEWCGELYDYHFLATILSRSQMMLNRL